MNASYDYTNNGNVLNKADWGCSELSEYTYDDLDRLKTWTVNGSVQEAYDYNVIGNMTSKTGMGTYTYGSKPHAVTATSNGGVFSYDGNGNMTSRKENGVTYTQAWNADNKLSSVSSNGASTSFIYDADGNRVKKTESGSVSFGDNFGGLDTASWSYNTTFQSTVNEGGQMVLRSNGAGGGSYVGNFYRNGSIVSGQSAVLDFKVDGTNTFAHFSLEGVANNACRVGLVTWSGKLMVQWIGCNWNNVTYTDMVNPVKVNTWYRLTMSVNDSTGFTLSVRERDTGAAAVNYSAAMPGTGQTWRFHHWIDTGSAWLDNYVERSDGTQTTVYIGGYFEKNVTTGGSTSYYAFGGKPVAMRQGGTVSFLHGDHLGSASVTTNMSGAKVSELRYTPFGETRYQWSNTATDKRFTGQRFEGGFGIYDYGARMYSPLLGRFLSADTIVPGAGNPQAFNRYAYSYNNPLRYSDPTGHRPDEQVTPPPKKPAPTPKPKTKYALGWSSPSDFNKYSFQSVNGVGMPTRAGQGRTDQNGCGCRNVLYPAANMISDVQNGGKSVAHTPKPWSGGAGKPTDEKFNYLETSIKLAPGRTGAGLGATRPDGLADAFNNLPGLGGTATAYTAANSQDAMQAIRDNIDKGNLVGIVWNNSGANGGVDQLHWVLAVGYDASSVTILNESVNTYQNSTVSANWSNGGLTAHWQPFSYVVFEP